MVVTGGTGFVGSALVRALAAEEKAVVVLTRDKFKARTAIKDLPPGADVSFVEMAALADAVRGADAVVNLAGEPISTRWTPEIKAEIRNSRVRVTNQLAACINDLPPEERPRVLVSASALGFYGTSETQTFTEASPGGTDYLAQVCREWEAAAATAQVQRRVVVRIGIVLADDGGALAKMVPLFKLFAGGPPGTGGQWFSWIDRDDLVRLIVAAVTDESYDGVVNGVAPTPVRMADFCERLGGTLGRPSWLPVPGFALNAVLGEGASVVLDGQKVVPERTQELGFEFATTDVQKCLDRYLVKERSSSLV